MNSQQKGIILLIKSALTGEKYSLPEQFDVEEACKTARRHQIVAILYYGALNCGVAVELSAMQKMFMETCKLISVNERQKHVLNTVLNKFDEEKIEYMPLKGVVLKNMYPKSEMRIMSDADILIKLNQYEKIRTIMQELEFTEDIESDHELIWTKNRILIELHKRLIPSYNKDYYEYFGDGWKLAQKDEREDSTRYKMSDEDQMIYLFTHYAKHYRDAGIGIKHIVDLWVYREKVVPLDENYIITELKKLELDEFYKNTMRTLEVWFNDAEADDITEFITGVIFNSGVYGTQEAKILSAVVKSSKTQGSYGKARFKKKLDIIFLPYSNMCKKYKILDKVAVLLPVMWVVRWVEALIFKRKKIKNQKEHLDVMATKRIDDYQQALNFVGLDFNFKE